LLALYAVDADFQNAIPSGTAWRRRAATGRRGWWNQVPKEIMDSGFLDGTLGPASDPSSHAATGLVEASEAAQTWPPILVSFESYEATRC